VTWVDLPGGGALELVAGRPARLRGDPERRFDMFGGVLLARAEVQAGQWLVATSAWAYASRPPHHDEPMFRSVALADAQPTHRVRFTPDEGPERAWLLRVQRETPHPGVAFTWTHAEWDAREGRFPTGGDWRLINKLWVYKGQTTPCAAPGVVSVDDLAATREVLCG